MKEQIINKGNGAGGSNTNFHGKQFEEKTNNEKRLLKQGYKKNTIDTKTKRKKKYNYCLSKTLKDRKIIFVLHNGFKIYMKTEYGIDMFRCPDEAYIIQYNTGIIVIKILEKKEQNVEGSVENKLWAGLALKIEYQKVLGEKFEVHYGFCLSLFLKKKITSTHIKYTTLY
jgi:hypothetical protein